MLKIKKRQNGSMLVVSSIAAVCLAVLILSFSKVMDFRSHQSAYYMAKRGAYELALAGLNHAMGEIIRVSDVNDYNNRAENIAGVYMASHKGRYWNRVELVSQAQRGNTYVNYYIRTTATLDADKGANSTILHNYVQLSNVGEYFAAVKGSLSISAGVNAARGKIYGENLKFEIPGGGVTTDLRGAEYRYTCEPPIVDDTDGDITNDVWTAPNITVNPNTGDINTSDGTPPFGRPRRLGAPIVFPQVLDSDIQNLCDPTKPNRQELNTNLVANQIVSGAQSSPRFICNSYDTGGVRGDIILRNVTVTGSVYFVAKGDIHIQGQLVKGTPGSLIDQAILIAQGDVIIDNLDGGTNPPVPVIANGADFQVQTIEALVLAPNGAFYPRQYTADPNLHGRLSYIFNGSMILARVSVSTGNNFPTVFQGPGGRVYNYDPAFRENPPTDLPVVSKTWYSFEETPNSRGVFN